MIADRGDALADRDRNQSGAFGESESADRGDAIAYRDGSQIFAPVESVITN